MYRFSQGKKWVISDAKMANEFRIINLLSKIWHKTQPHEAHVLIKPVYAYPGLPLYGAFFYETKHFGFYKFYWSLLLIGFVNTLSEFQRRIKCLLIQFLCISMYETTSNTLCFIIRFTKFKKCNLFHSEPSITVLFNLSVLRNETIKSKMKFI